MQKVLLHSCCAVCLIHPYNVLKSDGYEVLAYFYNPNIFPEKEYETRKQEFIEYCTNNNIDYLIEEDTQEFFINAIKGLENEPEKGKRCEECFSLRLKRSAKKAKELGIKAFTTTLSVSPHKVSDMIFKAGKVAQKEHDTAFLEYNFKKNNGFKIAQEYAKLNNMYKQNYCGCRFSIRKENQ